MKAAWYEQLGAPSEVLVIGELPTPEPGPGEVRIRVSSSGVNPGDVKKRRDTFGLGKAYPRVIPHSDGPFEFAQCPQPDSYLVPTGNRRRYDLPELEFRRLVAAGFWAAKV